MVAQIMERFAPSESEIATREYYDVGDYIMYDQQTWRVAGFYDSTVKSENAKNPGKWLPVPLQRVKTKQAHSVRVKFYLQSVDLDTNQLTGNYETLRLKTRRDDSTKEILHLHAGEKVNLRAAS